MIVFLEIKSNIKRFKSKLDLKNIVVYFLLIYVFRKNEICDFGALTCWWRFSIKTNLDIWTKSTIMVSRYSVKVYIYLILWRRYVNQILNILNTLIVNKLFWKSSIIFHFSTRSKKNVQFLLSQYNYSLCTSIIFLVIWKFSALFDFTLSWKYFHVISKSRHRGKFSREMKIFFSV